MPHRISLELDVVLDDLTPLGLKGDETPEEITAYLNEMNLSCVDVAILAGIIPAGMDIQAEEKTLWIESFDTTSHVLTYNMTLKLEMRRAELLESTNS